MILVPVLLEHRVDLVRSGFADMDLHRSDEIVQMFVEPRIRKAQSL